MVASTSYSNQEELALSLVEEGFLSKAQLILAQESQKNLGDPLEKILIDRGFVEEEKLLKFLAKKMKTTFVDLTKYKVDEGLVHSLPVSLAKKYSAIPLFKIEDKITIATSNPMNLSALDDIGDAMGGEISAMLSSQADIEQAIRECYRATSLTEKGRGVKIEVVDSFEDGSTDTSAEKLEREAAVKDVVTAVNNIISQAYEDRASDIHLEPTRESLKIRLRIDGVLEELQPLAKKMHLPVISRIKIMGKMDVAERRLPQDGRVRIRIGQREMDIRIATYPTMFGEAAALRMLSQDQVITLENLGFQESDLKIFERLIHLPHGILLVTGPTGSGKTTSLYASLLKMNTKEKHILSIEDPIEHEIPSVDQQQVNIKAGMTFATSLRAMLRQDPDVIMVGEIRDQETADMSIRAAMTGHLVLSTLHTNSAIGAFSRLKDLGIEPYLVASTVAGVMAQRLVRKICEHCKKETQIPIEEMRKVGIRDTQIKLFKGEGCSYCRNTGYSGRIGLFEIVQVTDDVRIFINKESPEVRIREKIAAMGHHSIMADGMEKVKAGLTTIDEVLRVNPQTDVLAQ